MRECLAQCDSLLHLVLSLCDQSAGGGGLVLPGRRQGTDSLVVAGQAVNAGLDQNEAELAVLVLAVTLEMLADSNSLEADGVSDVLALVSRSHGAYNACLLDQHVKVLGDLRCEAYGITLSVFDRCRGVMYGRAMLLCRLSFSCQTIVLHLPLFFQAGGVIPLLFRIRRILLPARPFVSRLLISQLLSDVSRPGISYQSPP